MDDRRLETFIGNLLRTGVLLAAAIVFAGGTLYLVQRHSVKIDYERFVAGGADTRTIPGIVHSAMRLQSAGLIQFGLLLLIATPIARVALAAAGFYLERDHLYTAVSLIVLAILVFSLLHAS